VNKGVVSAAIRRDKPVTFDLIEEFYRSGGQIDFPSMARPNDDPLLLGAKREGKGAAKRL